MSFRKEKRQMCPESRFSRIDVLTERLSHIWAEAEKERMKLSQDPVMFFEQVVGFKPTAYQRDLAEKFVNIATEKTIGEKLELWDFESVHRGCNLYAGLDLGRLQDYSVLVVVEEVKGKFYLRHLKIFELGTSYASVIGYLKTLQDRWGGFCKIRVDSTNQDYVVEDMKNSGIENVEGVHFTLPRKQEMATLLKQRMVNNQFWHPYLYQVAVGLLYPSGRDSCWIPVVRSGSIMW